MMMALILVMGIPGSGKTTLSKKLEEALGPNALRMSFDEVFGYSRVTGEQMPYSALGLHGYNGYRSFVRNERKIYESMIRNGLNMKKEGKFSVPPYESILWNISDSFIIVDDIFYLRSMRRPFERMARAFSLCYIVIFLDPPLEVALQRNMGRPPKVFIPEQTIRRIYEEMELPAECGENFIRFSTSDEFSLLVTKIQSIFLNFKEKNCDKVAEIPVENILPKNNTWQELEKDLRKCISELVSESKSEDLARSLGKVKKEVITKFRRSNLKSWKYSDLKALLLSELSIQKSYNEL